MAVGRLQLRRKRAWSEVDGGGEAAEHPAEVQPAGEEGEAQAVMGSTAE